MKKFYAVFLIFSFVISCDDPYNLMDTHEQLIGTSWNLEEIEGDIVSDQLISTIEFSEKNKISGLAGCNRYFSSYVIGNTGFKVGEIALTKMLCPKKFVDHENNFIRSIQSATYLKLDNEMLHIHSVDKKILLKFSRIQSK